MLESIDCAPQAFSFVDHQQNEMNADTFWRYCAEYQQKIRHLQANNTEVTVIRAALFDTEPGAFCYKLFALLNQGVEVVLPANMQPETLSEAQQTCDLVCGNAPWQATSHHIDKMTVSGENEFAQQANWPSTGQLVFSTSGSTGKSKLIIKSWVALLRELNQLVGQFPHQGAITFIPTVPHYHIYGLLFRVLLPMQLGATIYAIKAYPEHFLPILAQPQTRRVVVVSSPAFLERLSEDTVLDDYADKLCCFVSSGGVLSEHAVDSLYEHLSAMFYEVYGSTESGGIASRIHGQVFQPLWTPFELIKVRAQANTQRLILDSVYLDDVEIKMDDKVEIYPNGQFKLLGRIDRTVKIEEKRVNLSDLERYLCEHDGVDTCRLLVIKRQRLQLAAVVVVNESVGERPGFKLSQQLRKHLANKFELICVPKKWRYVETLPVNDQGKVTIANLEGLFE
ncbi:AMP-binding protein [Pseudoalteromonas luteoviolacea]|uniref:AMP-dependent synthetase/ligase domain-containing protein n=1 Tax=Pseudoalteromonas luteoviolacea H33 TaxID=1365251 RepID=A0A167EDN8_9GAMM|nr:AMP-binding protein [Pseudoalteromonas luteoviolacea]KZN50440.1 hypothetical protein N476_16480 [Pseudoalteromonas luteoviolacea H33]KZN77911.1 hypothetical protein N477_10985 [Pseudoalteromonas luteoviolacea H33-S]